MSLLANIQAKICKDGPHLVSQDKACWIWLTDGLYHRISGDYVAAANLLSIRPCQLQAVTWVTFRRLHSV